MVYIIHRKKKGRIHLSNYAYLLARYSKGFVTRPWRLKILAKDKDFSFQRKGHPFAGVSSVARVN